MNYYNVMMRVRNKERLVGAMNVEKDIRQDYGSVTEAQIKKARMNKLKIVGVLFLVNFVFLLKDVDQKYYEKEVGF